MTSDTKEKAIESKTRILNDYILMDIFKYSDIKDLFRWIRISKQFSECIHRELKLENQLMVANNKSEKFIYKIESYKLLFKVRESESHRRDFRVTNIESAISLKSNTIFAFYYLNQSLCQLRTICDKFQAIQYLSLCSCYLEESVIKFFDQYMNSLKCLLLINCHFSKSRFEIFCKSIENFTKNVTHLSFFTKHSHFIEDNSRFDDSFLLSFISSFKNLKQLRILLNESSKLSQLFSQLSPNLEDLFVCSFTKENSRILIDFNNQLNTLKLKHLLIFYHCILTEQTLESIINSTNLETFGFCCLQIQSRLLIDLAKKHKNLKRLYISEAEVKGYITTGTLFAKVTHVRLFCCNINPIQFKQLIISFPILKTLHFLNEINCYEDNEDKDCKGCQNLCYDFIPSIESLRKISIDVFSINKSFLQSINRFPNLNHLWLTSILNTEETETQLNSYSSYFIQIVEILIEICDKNPKKIFKLEFEIEMKALPSYLSVPRNLLFIKSNKHKYFDYYY